MEKGQPAVESIDAYIAAFPPDVQARLQSVRETIRAVAPTAVEGIRYGIPTFILEGNLVHFGGFKKHIGFFPGSSGIAQFKDALAAYPNSKGTVQFAFDRPLPLELIREITLFRVGENQAIAAARRAKKRKPAT